jgi:RHS repeat-associated protein
LLASTKTGTTYEYATADQLGTPRAWTDHSGNLVAGGRHDYLPFGGELFADVGNRTTGQGYGTNTQQDGQRKQFTSKERDAETGLDYFLARYHSSAQGRFASVDPENYGAEPEDPQSWNGYAYARNNPVLYTDPDGRKHLVCSPSGVHCDFVSDREFDLDRASLESQGLVFTGGGNFRSQGSILFNGELQATYQRVSFDDLSDLANGLIFGREGLGARAKGMKQFVGLHALAGLAGGSIVGVGVYALGGGAGVTTLGINWGREAWRVIRASRPLEKMGHAAKHFEKFQKYANLTKEEVAKILEYVRQTGTQVGSSHGGRILEKVVEIGGQQVRVRVVESASGIIKTGLPIN